jgi:hypothetical protein
MVQTPLEQIRRLRDAYALVVGNTIQHRKCFFMTERERRSARGRADRRALAQALALLRDETPLWTWTMSSLSGFRRLPIAR